MRVALTGCTWLMVFTFAKLEYSKHLILSVWEINYLFRILLLIISNKLLSAFQIFKERFTPTKEANLLINKQSVWTLAYTYVCVSI